MLFLFTYYSLPALRKKAYATVIIMYMEILFCQITKGCDNEAQSRGLSHNSYVLKLNVYVNC